MQVACNLYRKLGFERSLDLDFLQEDMPVFGFRLWLDTNKEIDVNDSPDDNHRDEGNISFYPGIIPVEKEHPTGADAPNKRNGGRIS